MGESASCIDRAVSTLVVTQVEVEPVDLQDQAEPSCLQEIAVVAERTGVNESTVYEVVRDYKITPKDFEFLGVAMRAAIEASRTNPGVFNPELEDSNLLRKAA